MAGGNRYFRTEDHPLANGRLPLAGEQAWTCTFRLEDGTQLEVHMGREARDTFRNFVLREEMDDFVDEVGGATRL